MLKVQIPQPIHTQPGDPRIIQTIDAFFNEVKRAAEQKYRTVNFRFNSSSREIESAYKRGQLTDDRITLLHYSDVPIAGALEIRTDSNYVNCVFFESVDNIRQRAEPIN